MKPIDSTAEILYLRMLNRSVDRQWADWAYDMLVTGFDTESLVILAGETAFYNQFEMQKLADKVLVELNLSVEDRELVLRNYIAYLLKKTLNGEMDVSAVLDLLKEGYWGWNCESALADFAMLYWAKADLDKYGEQRYWNGASKENIDEVITEYFMEWLRKHEHIH